MNTTPALFIGHGSPMLAIQADNPFMPAWRTALDGAQIRGIVCISAHWTTPEVRVTGSLKPETIHDFYGFPNALYAIDYPAHGSLEIAKRVQAALGEQVIIDATRGLDHGAWAVLREIDSEASMPVVQLSISAGLSLKEHFALAKNLRELREEGYLILGSGNLVHNLRLIDRQHINHLTGFDWALNAQDTLVGWIRHQNIEALTSPDAWPQSVRLAVPTLEHFIPALYVLATWREDDEINIFNQECVGGSLDMTCLKLQAA